MSHKEPYNAPAAVFVAGMADDDGSGHFASQCMKLPAADEPRQAKATGRTRRGSGKGHTPPYQNPRTYTPSRLMVYRMGGGWNWTYPRQGTSRPVRPMRSSTGLRAQKC
jgi:hypothetical protein